MADPYKKLKAMGPWYLACLAFAMFGLLGVTLEMLILEREPGPLTFIGLGGEFFCGFAMMFVGIFMRDD